MIMFLSISLYLSACALTSIQLYIFRLPHLFPLYETVIAAPILVFNPYVIKNIKRPPILFLVIMLSLMWMILRLIWMIFFFIQACYLVNVQLFILFIYMCVSFIKFNLTCRNMLALILYLCFFIGLILRPFDHPYDRVSTFRYRCWNLPLYCRSIEHMTLYINDDNMIAEISNQTFTRATLLMVKTDKSYPFERIELQKVNKFIIIRYFYPDVI